MKTQTLIIRVEYDEEKEKKPSDWYWSGLIGCDDCVKLLNYGAIEDEELSK
jgi:hypothetical protein